MFITRAHHNIDWPMQKEKKLAGKETGWDRMTTLGNFSFNDKSLTWLTGRLRANAGEICPLYRYLSKPCSLLQLHRAVKWSLWDSTNMAWQSWQNLWQAEDMNSFHFLAANQAATSITTFFFAWTNNQIIATDLLPIEKGLQFTWCSVNFWHCWWKQLLRSTLIMTMRHIFQYHLFWNGR